MDTMRTPGGGCDWRGHVLPPLISGSLAAAPGWYAVTGSPAVAGAVFCAAGLITAVAVWRR